MEKVAVLPVPIDDSTTIGTHTGQYPELERRAKWGIFVPEQRRGWLDYTADQVVRDEFRLQWFAQTRKMVFNILFIIPLYARNHPQPDMVHPGTPTWRTHRTVPGQSRRGPSALA